MTNEPNDSRSPRSSGAARASRAIPDDKDTPPRRASIKDGDLSTAMELGEFMGELGVVMRLPKRESVAAAAPVQAQTVRSPVRVRRLLPLVAVVTLVAFAAIQLRPAPVAVVPAQVIGTWETVDARYPGRRLVLSEHGVLVLVLSMPQGAVEVVHRVTEHRVHDTLAVVLSYGSSTPVAELALAYVGQPREQLILRNTSGVVWTRATATPAQTPR